MRIKTENIEVSLEPVDVDKAGSEASEEGTHGLSKMVALLGSIIKDSLRLAKNFGQPEATCSEGRLWTIGYSSQP